MRYDFASARARPGPEIDDVVGRPDGFFIVFNYDDGIAQITQAVQGPQQLTIVALVQPNAWFVQNVKHSSKAGADLCRQSNPLCFAPGERAALAIEREITEPNFNEELQSRLNFTHHIAHDSLLLRS